MIVVDPMVPMSGCPGQLERRLVQLRLVGPFTLAVWPIGRRTTEIAVGPHCAIAMIAVNRAARCIDRNMVVVHAETIALSVAVREQPRL